ncbi:MAG: cyclic nucleotide-binding domain-containing protein [bacterium]|nr:cyclic nucleotide-binding domain-containing protein [bacterium]
MNQRDQQMIQVIQRIDIFKGLSLQEVQQLIQVCKIRNYEAEQKIYKAGEPSTEMLILLKGQLLILSPSGELVGSAASGAAIGEMGVFTGQPRSATIVAAVPSAGMTVRKIEIEGLMSRNAAIYVKVLKNVVTLLSKRLSDANALNDKHMKTVSRLEDELEKAWGRGTEQPDEEEGTEG